MVASAVGVRTCIAEKRAEPYPSRDYDIQRHRQLQRGYDHNKVDHSKAMAFDSPNDSAATRARASRSCFEGSTRSLRIFVQVRSSPARPPAPTFEMNAPPQKRSVISQGLQQIALHCLEATVVAVCRSVTKNRILRARPMGQTHLSPILCRNHLQLQYTYRSEVHREQTPSESEELRTWRCRGPGHYSAA